MIHRSWGFDPEGQVGRKDGKSLARQLAGGAQIDREASRLVVVKP